MVPKRKPENILERASWCLALKAIRKALEGSSAGASARCNIVHVHKPYDLYNAFFSQ